MRRFEPNSLEVISFLGRPDLPDVDLDGYGYNSPVNVLADARKQYQRIAADHLSAMEGHRAEHAEIRQLQRHGIALGRLPREIERMERDHVRARAPTRNRLSLTRARPSSERASRANRWRAMLFSAVARSAVWAVGDTMSLRTMGEANLARVRGLGPGRLLFALWHGDFFPIFHYARRNDICVLVSRSPDGEILDRILRAYGYQTVRGSNTRGATRAMIDLARLIRQGSDAAIAVDGPKGPAFVAKAGIIWLAKVTGCPIVPLAAGMSRFKQFASWDRFRLPYPFSRVLAIADTPIQVPADASQDLSERRRRELEQSLLALRTTAQQLVQREHFDRADVPLGFAASMTALSACRSKAMVRCRSPRRR